MRSRFLQYRRFPVYKDIRTLKAEHGQLTFLTPMGAQVFCNLSVNSRLHSSQRTSSLPAPVLSVAPTLNCGLTSGSHCAAVGLHQARDLVLAGAVLILVKVVVPVVHLRPFAEGKSATYKPE